MQIEFAASRPSGDYALVTPSAGHNRPAAKSLDDKAKGLLAPEARQQLGALAGALETCEPWDIAGIEAVVREFATAANLKLGQIAQPLRAALTGSATSPGIFEVAAVLGRAETVARIRDVAG